MLSYCLKCRKVQEKSPKVVKTNKGKIMLSSKCAFCNSKKPKFTKTQEAKKLLSMIGKIAILEKILI